MKRFSLSFTRNTCHTIRPGKVPSPQRFSRNRFFPAFEALRRKAPPIWRAGPTRPLSLILRWICPLHPAWNCFSGISSPSFWTTALSPPPGARAQGLNHVIQVYVDTLLIHPVLKFRLLNGDAGVKEAFLSVIRSSLQEVSVHGLSRELCLAL